MGETELTARCVVRMNTEQLPKQRLASRAMNRAQANSQALEEGVTPLELCTRFWKLHTEIYE
jgi:hypothetical protein